MPDLTKKQQRYIDHYSKTGRVMESCTYAGVSHQSIRTWREKDYFIEALDAAEEAYCDLIEAEIHRRAIDGVEEDVYGAVGGGLTGKVGTKRKYSDKLLEMQAKSRMSKYKDKVQVDAKIEGTILAIPIAARSESEYNKMIEEQE